MESRRRGLKKKNEELQEEVRELKEEDYFIKRSRNREQEKNQLFKNMVNKLLTFFNSNNYHGRMQKIIYGGER